MKKVYPIPERRRNLLYDRIKPNPKTEAIEIIKGLIIEMSLIWKNGFK